MSRESAKKYRESERGKAVKAAIQRRYAATAKGKAAHNAWKRKQYAADSAKQLARTAVNHALRDGKLERKPCEVCGAVAEAHHEDYTKPLDVNWLCSVHHRMLHAGTLKLSQVGEQR